MGEIEKGEIRLEGNFNCKGRHVKGGAKTSTNIEQKKEEWTKKA